MQEAAVVLVVLLAIGFLIRRKLKSAGNCCGEEECPAAKGIADRLQEVARK